MNIYTNMKTNNKGATIHEIPIDAIPITSIQLILSIKDQYSNRIFASRIKSFRMNTCHTRTPILVKRLTPKCHTKANSWAKMYVKILYLFDILLYITQCILSYLHLQHTLFGATIQKLHSSNVLNIAHMSEWNYLHINLEQKLPNHLQTEQKKKKNSSENQWHLSIYNLTIIQWKQIFNRRVYDDQGVLCTI